MIRTWQKNTYTSLLRQWAGVSSPYQEIDRMTVPDTHTRSPLLGPTSSTGGPAPPPSPQDHMTSTPHPLDHDTPSHIRSTIIILPHPRIHARTPRLYHQKYAIACHRMMGSCETMRMHATEMPGTLIFFDIGSQWPWASLVDTMCGFVP